MNRFAISALLLAPLFANAALLGTERTWEFMQAVGGIRLGKPVFKLYTIERAAGSGSVKRQT